MKHIPNVLTAARLLSAPYILYLLYTAQYRTALVWFSVAAATDVLDGFLARRFHVGSRMGALLDPVADKVLLSGSFLTLGLRRVIPWWLAAIVLGRDLMILTFAIVALARKSKRDFPPSVWGKASTAAQVAYTIFAVAYLGSITPLLVATILSWIAVTLTLWSGIDYFRRVL